MFVDHSLDSFILRYDKTKMPILYKEKPKGMAIPFQLSQEDLEKRLEMFKKLQKLVITQRKTIKKNDKKYQDRIETQLKYKRKLKLTQVDELNSIITDNSITTNKKNYSFDANSDHNKGNLTSKNKKKLIISSQDQDSKSFSLPPLKKLTILE